MRSTRRSLIGAAIFVVAVSLLLNASSLFAEAPLAGLKIGAEQTPGGKMFYTATNATGAYSFAKLPPGNYILHVPNQPNKTVAAADGKITGQLTVAPKVAKAVNANSKTKDTQGKRYVWVPAATGSNIGGNWVEVGQIVEDSRAGDALEAEQRRNLSRQRPGN
jgi:hypothetical protein